MTTSFKFSKKKNFNFSECVSFVLNALKIFNFLVILFFRVVIHINILVLIKGLICKHL